MFTPVHVPQLIRAVNHKALTVKVLCAVAVEPGVPPQAAVVVAGGQLLALEYLSRQSYFDF